MPDILTPGGTAAAALDRLRTFSSEEPDLIKTGLTRVDATIGGLFPGQGGVLGIAQGVGKSSTILRALLNAGGGAIFVEDTEDVVGTRFLSDVTGINGLDMRRKTLSGGQKVRLNEAVTALRERDDIWTICHPGASIDAIAGYVEELAGQGCRIIWLDYIQKVRGIRDDRHNEVATAYTRFQQACFANNCAFMVASQFARQVDPTKRPRLSWLKESGDLENEARIAVLGWRNPDDRNLIHYVLEKSTVGGEGTVWSYRRDESGVLRESSSGEEDFW
jgi:replicative DNA helicase